MSVMNSESEPRGNQNVNESAQTGGQVISVRRFKQRDGAYRWNDVDVKEYGKVGDFFRDISKQVFFDYRHGLSCELRYFEVKPGGYSSFEQHEHVHGVIVLRGKGMVIAASEQGTERYDIAEYDVVHVPPVVWHQFQAAPDEYLGFLCLVENERDRGRRPSDEERDRIAADPTIGRIARF